MPEAPFIEGGQPAPDHSNPVHVKALQSLLADKAAQEAHDLSTVLASPEGRRLLWRLLEHTEPYASTFSQSHATQAALEGKRQVGVWLIAAMAAVDPLAYPRLMADAAKERELDGLIRAARLADAQKKDDQA